jgi:D-alanyl-D-alanine carboxypeptidase/D-alanyl-D-alanine-endopeptidase (penicillin-binding protein 4)
MKNSAYLLLCLIALLLPALAGAQHSIPVGVKNVLNHRQLPDDSLSLYVENLRTGKAVIAWHEDVPRNPASVMKLLTTLIALETLGPTYTWKTEVYLLGEVEGDTLRGDLLLKGYGDPFLVTERLWSLLRALLRSGITTIDGDLLLDDSHFDTGDYDPGAFDNQPLRAYNVAANALLMNFQVVRFQFEPDVASAMIKLRLDPELENLQVVNQLSLKDGRCGGYQRGITITPNESVDRMIFSGAFPAGCRSYTMDRAVLGHNAFAYGLVKALWREMGGEITGGWRNAITPEDAEPFVTYESPPLTEIITRVNKHSNNVMARQLVYTLAAEQLGSPGTSSKGEEVVSAWLDDRQFDFAELNFDNGAGLSRNARLTARHLGELLRYAWHSPLMPEFVASMSLSGIDGTLARRFRDESLTGIAHMKTGSLDHVSSIAGYVQAQSGDRFIVVALQNYENVHRGTGDEVHTALLRWVQAL